MNDAIGKVLAGSVGPVWSSEAAPGTDGWRTDKSCLGRTSVSVCLFMMIPLFKMSPLEPGKWSLVCRDQREC